jgi:hypothetical protein
MGKAFHRTFFLNGPAGRLEALLWSVAQASPHMGALVCHPHPLYGGTMHNKVVFHVAKTLQSLGLPVLRFNFRGAGLSEGEHDKGRGEQNDVRTSLDFLAEEFPGRPIVLAGFSFGCWVGLRVGCADARVTHLIGLGAPANSSDFSYLRECSKPKLVIQGARDPYGSRENVQKLMAGVPGPKRLVIVEGADHFFTGKLSQVDAALREWIKEDR